MAGPPDSQLGALAVRKGFASQDEVLTALELQKRFEPSADRPSARVGEILVEMGALTDDMLRVLLEEQTALRERALSESAGTLPTVPADAAAPSGTLTVKSSVAVSVNGKPIDGPCTLAPGDVVRIGNAVVTFDGPGAGPSLVPPAEAPKEAAPAGMLDRARRAVSGITTRVFKRGHAEEVLPAGPSEGLGAKLSGAAAKTGETVRKLFKAVAKLKPKDRPAAHRKRDELLQAIARAGLKGPSAGSPEAKACVSALSALDQAEHRTSMRGSAVTPDEISAQRNHIRAAKERVEMTLVRFGLELLEKGPVPAGMEKHVAEIRAIEESLKE
jgi:hypothetical protein